MPAEPLITLSLANDLQSVDNKTLTFSWTYDASIDTSLLTNLEFFYINGNTMPPTFNAVELDEHTVIYKLASSDDSNAEHTYDPSTPYTFFVEVTDASGVSHISNTVVFTSPGLITPPSFVSKVELNNQVDVTMSYNISDTNSQPLTSEDKMVFTLLNINNTVNSVQHFSIDPTSRGQQTFSLTGLENYKKYLVIANIYRHPTAGVNQPGLSKLSDPFYISPSDYPLASSNVKFIGDVNGNAWVEWTDPSDFAGFKNILFKNGVDAVAHLYLYEGANGYNSNDPSLSFSIDLSYSTPYTGNRTFQCTGLKPFTRYWISIRYENGYGYGLYTPRVSTYTFNAMDAVSDLVATNQYVNGNYQKSVVLTWGQPSLLSQPVAASVKFQKYVAIMDVSGTLTEIDISNASTTTATFDYQNLDAELHKTLRFAVHTVTTSPNADTINVPSGHSQASSTYVSPDATTTAPAYTYPDDPTAVTFIAHDKQASISWTPSSNQNGSVVTKYDAVLVDISSNQLYTTSNISASATSAVVTGLTNTNIYRGYLRTYFNTPVLANPSDVALGYRDVVMYDPENIPDGSSYSVSNGSLIMPYELPSTPSIRLTPKNNNIEVTITTGPSNGRDLKYFSISGVSKNPDGSQHSTFDLSFNVVNQPYSSSSNNTYTIAITDASGIQNGNDVTLKVKVYDIENGSSPYSAMSDPVRPHSSFIDSPEVTIHNGDLNVSVDGSGNSITIISILVISDDDQYSELTHNYSGNNNRNIVTDTFNCFSGSSNIISYAVTATYVYPDGSVTQQAISDNI